MAVGCHYFPPGLRAVTFLAEERHRPLTSTKLYCLMKEAHTYEQLAEGCYASAAPVKIEPTT